ncbi:hypothetical protein EST38_g14274, partial [Candolleomyces aberdarensis]
MADDNDPRISELESMMYKFPLGVNVDSYLTLAQSHRESLEIDLAAARTVGNAELAAELLGKDKVVLTNIIRLRRLKDHRILDLESVMKTLPKTLDEVNGYLEVAQSHQKTLNMDLTAARSLCYKDLASVLEKAEKTTQSNIGKLRRHKGKLNKLAAKQPSASKRSLAHGLPGEESAKRQRMDPSCPSSPKSPQHIVPPRSPSLSNAVIDNPMDADPKDAGFKDVVPKDIDSMDIDPKDAIPKDVNFQDVVSRDVGSTSVVPKEVDPTSTIPKAVDPTSTIPKVFDPTSVVPKEV